MIGRLNEARCDSLWISSSIVIDLPKSAIGQTYIVWTQLDGALSFRSQSKATETRAWMRHSRFGVTP